MISIAKDLQDPVRYGGTGGLRWPGAMRIPPRQCEERDSCLSRSPLPTILFALLIAAGPIQAWAAVKPEPTPPPQVFDPAAIEAWLRTRVSDDGPVGLSVAMVRDGKVVFAAGYGKSVVKTGELVGTNTIFAIGSVSKQFTSACVFLLQEEGKLSVTDPVAKYYPELTQAKDITLLDLMQHVSGYPDYYPLDFVDRRMMKPIAEDDLIREYAGGKLDFKPGTRWSYSNTGFIILGRVVEKVSGTGFREFLQERIFDPLGMDRTRYEAVPGKDGVAQGYTSFAFGPPEPSVPEQKGWIGAAGGIFSTPLDLAKWDLALMEGRILKPESVRQMTTARVLADGRSTGYGCGLSISQTEGVQILSHGGAVSGFAAQNALMPIRRSALVLLANGEFGLGEVYGPMLKLLLPTKAEVPKVAGPSPEQLARELFARLQEGKVDRSRLAGEYNHFLTEEKVRAGSRRLKAFGKVERSELMSRSERGGLEVSVVRLRFKSRTIRALTYRAPDGKIEQFLLLRD